MAEGRIVSPRIHSSSLQKGQGTGSVIAVWLNDGATIAADGRYGVRTANASRLETVNGQDYPAAQVTILDGISADIQIQGPNSLVLVGRIDGVDDAERLFTPETRFIQVSWDAEFATHWVARQSFTMAVV